MSDKDKDNGNDKFGRILAQAEVAHSEKTDTGNSAESIDEKLKKTLAASYKMNFDNAVKNGKPEEAKHWAAQLASIGYSAGGTSATDVEREVAKAEQHEDLVSNLASSAAQAAVTSAVSSRMDFSSKSFFDSLNDGKEKKLLTVNADGSYDKSTLRNVDGKELQDAFANLELGKMDSNERKGVIEKIQHSLGIDSRLSEEERMRAMKPALDKMEQYKAALIYLSGGKDSDIKKNHEVFDRARAQVDHIVDMQSNMGNNSKAGSDIKEKGAIVLDGEKQDLRKTLEKINAILLDKQSGQYAVSGGQNPADPQNPISGLFASIKGAIGIS